MANSQSCTRSRVSSVGLTSSFTSSKLRCWPYLLCSGFKTAHGRLSLECSLRGHRETYLHTDDVLAHQPALASTQSVNGACDLGLRGQSGPICLAWNEFPSQKRVFELELVVSARQPTSRRYNGQLKNKLKVSKNSAG